MWSEEGEEAAPAAEGQTEAPSGSSPQKEERRWGEWESAESSATSSPSSSVQSPPPQTPLFSPASSSGPESPAGPDADDLSDALQAEGWRKCFSSRENKTYFFNKLTQQSLWEMPRLGAARKRAHSSASSPGQPPPAQPYKKFIPSEDWDLGVESGVRIRERLPASVLPTSCQAEHRRAEAFRKLRSLVEEARQGKDLPLDWLQRWVMERKLTETGKEPLLPSCCSERSALLERELLGCVPLRGGRLGSLAEARRQAGRYAEAAKTLAESSPSLTPDERKQVKWQCQAMFQFLRQQGPPTQFEELINRLAFLKTQCGPILVAASRPAVRSLVEKLESSSSELAAQLEQEQRAELVAAGVEVEDTPLPPPRADKVVRCYPVQLRHSTPRSAAHISMEQSPSGYVKLVFRSPDSARPPEVYKINAAHFFKLEQLYRQNCFDDRRFDLFLSRVWCLVKRYQNLFGEGSEGVALQRALPVGVLRLLKAEWGATFEAFASPFTSYFPQYCSLFPDTDGFFGSRGRWSELEPLEGGVVLAPPWVEEVMEAGVRRAMEALRHSRDEGEERPLSFFVVLPESGDEGQDGVSRAEALVDADPEFLRRKFRLPAHCVQWRHGAQHLLPSQAGNLLVRAPRGLQLFLLQNSAAAERHPVTKALVTGLIAAFKAPGPQPPAPATPAAQPHRPQMSPPSNARMPFIGLDWRSTGEAWEKTSEGSWERTKLRPLVQAQPLGPAQPTATPASPIPIPGSRGEDSDCEVSGDSPSSSPLPASSSLPALLKNPPPEPLAQPHCFVKTTKRSEFVGCTSLSEAFHKLDMARAVGDVRRLNYVSKVVSILVTEKLEGLSGSGRRMVLGVVEALVRQSLGSGGEVGRVRGLVGRLAEGLEGGSHVGSPSLLSAQAESAASLRRLLEGWRPAAPAEVGEDEVTLVDLPRECLRAVLRRLPDPDALIAASEALDQLIVNENALWRGLANFHFSPAQLGALGPTAESVAEPKWRHAFFVLKRRHGLRETYADVIQICCHCKALHWKDRGHPCVSNDDPPSVRVTPHQFVLMLLFL